jgi:hypothetical protein
MYGQLMQPQFVPYMGNAAPYGGGYPPQQQQRGQQTSDLVSRNYGKGE